MKRLLLFLALLSPVPAWATFSAPAQAVFNNSCAASSSCAVTVSAIGAGHLLVVLAHIGNTQTLSSVTAAGETFTIVGNCRFLSGGNTTQTGCAYAFKSVGGATTVTCNWSGTATASNTSCGFYEIAYTAPRLFLESNALSSSNGSAATFPGIDFSVNYLQMINGTNDILFQFANVSTGTVSAINTSFVLDNHSGQVADAHRLNTFDNTAPTWTNSGAATSIVTALAFGEDYNPNTAAVVPATTLNNGFQLSYSGTVGTRLVTITAPGQFKLAFDEGDNWGMGAWYDLVNDPGATNNLVGPAYGFGTLSPASGQPGVFNRTYYDFDPSDTLQYIRSFQYFFTNTPRQLSILEYNSLRVVIETKGQTAISAQGINNNLIGTCRYYIYPNGQIYVHYVVTLQNGGTFTPFHIFSDITLEDPTRTTAGPPDTQGWIRASKTQNPYVNAALEDYVFAYWGTGTSAPYTNWTKASVLLVHSPNNLHDGGLVIHSWNSGPGYGVLRWGFMNTDTFAIGAGGTETEDMLIQLGTQGSTVLPNITSSTVADPIAAAYIANPTPPGPSLEPGAAVNQNTTMQFTATDPGTWACTGTDNAGSASTCHGSINSSTGLYTAPASVTAQHTFGGFQLLPNNHIFNTRIDGLSVNTNNAAWMTAAQLAGGSPNWQTDFPVNYLSSASATDNMSFIYTPANNDIFNVPSFPTAHAEHGWFHAKQGVTTTDHHVLSVNTDTGMFSDFYQYFATCTTTAAAVAGNVATLTCSANPTTTGFVVGDANLVVGGFTGGDTYFNGGPFTITQVTATSISFALTHANASASTNGHASMNGSCISPGNCNSVSGIKYQNSAYALPPISTDAAGMEIQPLVLGLQELEHAVASGGSINHAFRNTFGLGAPASANIWPATTFAFDGNTVPFGARLRLKSSFNIAPYSAIAQVLLTALKNYGTFLVDGGNNWPMNAEQTRWPAAYYAALNEISGIGGTLAANMEFVDESALMVSATSGLTTLNREIVTFTRTSDSATASVDVALQGVAVNLPQDYLYIQAGSPTQQLTALVNIGTVTWSMSPAITGVTLTSGGLLTVASNVSPVQSSTITATSATDATVAASMTMTAFPTGGIYVLPPKAANYTDTQGHLWNKRTGVDLIDSLGCCSSSNTGSFPALTNISLWDSVVGYSGDIFADDTKLNFTLPNGTYHVTYNLGTYAGAGTFPASGLFIKLSVQGNVIFQNVDPSAIVGQFAKYTIKQNVTVSDNHLSFGIWAMNLGGAPISSFSIEQGSLDTGRTLSLGRKVTSGVTIR